MNSKTALSKRFKLAFSITFALAEFAYWFIGFVGNEPIAIALLVGEAPER
jgi:hypothetical protein